jgi:hypothetical protein
MHTAKHPTIGYGLTGVRTTANPAGRQRPLGKAYRLILSFEPKKAAPQEEVGAKTPQTEIDQLAPG